MTPKLEDIKKIALFAGYTIHEHNCMEKELKTGSYVKVKKLKIHDPKKFRSFEINPCNQWKPWEDQLECLRILDSTDPKNIKISRDSSGKWECEIITNTGFVVSFSHEIRETAIFMAVSYYVEWIDSLVHVSGFKCVGDYSHAIQGYCPDCMIEIKPEDKCFKVNINGNIHGWHVNCYNESHP